MHEYKCKVCGKSKYAKYPSHTKMFCSHSCSNIYKWENIRTKRIELVFNCERCNKSFAVYEKDHRILSGNKIRFCSMACQFPKINYTCCVCGGKKGSANMTCSKVCEITYRKRRPNKYNHKEYMKSYNTAYRAKNKDILKQKVKDKMENDDIFRFKINIRKHILQCFKRKSSSKTGSTESILGCTIPFFIEYISGKLKDGMTLANHGLWHLDHIKPLSIANTKEEIKTLCHYTNYQPLWAVDNIIKSNKY